MLDTFYFSSDRASECCLELFGASKARPKKRMTGTIVDCLTGAAMQGVKIQIINSDTADVKLTSNSTDSDGRYEILMEEWKKIKVSAGSEGYIEKTFELAANSPSDTLINSSVCLQEPDKKPFEPVAEDKPVVIPNVYYDFNEAVIKPESYPVLDSVVGLMQRFPTLAIEISGHTDGKGHRKQNKELSVARAKAFADYLIGKGIDAARLESKGYGEDYPIAPNKEEDGSDNPEGREKNRRSEIKVLHY